MLDERLQELSVRVGHALQTKGLLLAAAESCTGGWIAKVITDIPGSSEWFDRGFVTYTNAAKQDMLGVRRVTLDTEGAVSEATVREMAEGALRNSRAQVAVAVSGVAGPTGGSQEKPVGSVWLAWTCAREGTRARRAQFDGDREAVRRQSVVAALQGVLDVVGD